MSTYKLCLLLSQIKSMKFFFLFVLTTSLTFSQTQISKDYFRLPLEIPMQLAGNFGELRPNHFHAGFDFKTNQREGLNIYAVADGYVSRIKISNVGYGKAIYITHNNGTTSVYGHLQKSVGSIQDRIIQNQYLEKSYEIEVYLKPDDLNVKKGDIIGISGNTGGSEGPHLHFEIRDNKTEKTLNPLRFGLDLKDTKSPQVSNLMVYPIELNSVVNESKRPISLNLSLQKDGTYLAEKVEASGKIGFGIIASDFDDVSFNANGIYKAELTGNGKSLFKFELADLVFDEARFVNAYIDYGKYKKSHQRVQKLFMKNPFGLSNLSTNSENGLIDVSPNFNQTEEINVSDFNGNKITISIPISYCEKSAVISEEPKTSNYLVKAKSDAIFEKDNWSVSMPANTFYDDFYLHFNVAKDILFLHDDSIPAHSNFTISVVNKEEPLESERKKMFIASIYNGKKNYINTFYKENTFYCKTRTLGQFIVSKDTIAPKISISKLIQDKEIGEQKEIRFKISDDFSGIKTFNGYLNEKWVLFEYESKLKRIIHVLNKENLVNGKNTLKLIVTDNVGNSSVFETQFNNTLSK